MDEKEEFPYPACWNDDERMAVLYAPFRVRELNPENYDSKMKFWQDMIALYCKHNGTAIFSKLDLQTTFAYGRRMVYCLDTVVLETCRCKKIRLRSEYEYDPLNSWSGWAMNGLVWRPLAWGFGKLKSTVGLEDESTRARREFVHLESVEKFIKELHSKVLTHKEGKLLHYVDLKELVEKSKIRLKEDTLKLCLKTMHCRQHIGLQYKIEQSEKRIHLVKVPSPKTGHDIEITATDLAIHNLQMTQSNLLKQLEELETEITAVDEKVQYYLKDNKRQLAKNHLRKKHLLEKSHEKRSVALHNVETLLNSVDEACSHGEILDAYKIGSRALQDVLSKSGLKYDNVDEIIAEVRETLDTHNEIQEVMSAGGTFSETNLSTTENEQLESELRDIMLTEKKKETKQKELNQKICQLSQPSASPSKPTIKETSIALSNTLSNLISSPIKEPQQVMISDAELLSMLEQLEVEDGSVKSESSQNIHA